MKKRLMGVFGALFGGLLTCLVAELLSFPIRWDAVTMGTLSGMIIMFVWGPWISRVTMSNRSKLDKIIAFQTAGYVHPMTCGVDSSHALLMGVIQNREVILKCPTCGYVQNWVPPMVYDHDWSPKEKMHG